MNTLKIAESTVSILKQVPEIGAPVSAGIRCFLLNPQNKVFLLAAENLQEPLSAIVVYDVEAHVEPICSHYDLTTNKERDGHQL
ncbi:hypothetical protein Pelo_19577 [Pelomyxa schiedti]|nr:hypothetical protein Pelo_19577 [Pelomyxa schiedti]